MKKPIIGILPTYNLKNDNNDPYKDNASFVRMYANKIVECGGIPIGLLEQNVSMYKELCDAYIWPGGNKIWPEFNDALIDAINNNKPFLGVCMGSQAIATLLNVLEDQKTSGLSYKETYDLNKKENPYLIPLEDDTLHNHTVTKEKESILNAKHKIKIKPNTILYDIFKEEEQNVVSLHSIVISRVPSNLVVSAVSIDNVIEAVEYNINILGVQFHPEIEEERKIFTWLVNKAKENEKRKK